MKQKAFGFDIGGTTMKVVWLSSEKEGYTVLAAKTEPTPPKGMLSDSPLEQQQMAEAIKKLVAEAKVTTPYVHVALPESQVYTRAVEMPMLSDRELTSAIYWEAEQHIPIPLKETTIDWQVLRRSQQQEGGGKMEVLLVGAPTTLVDKYEKIFTLAGLSIVSIETEILSTIRPLIFTPPQSGASNTPFPTSIVVNIGAASTPFAILKDETIVFTYSVPTGGLAINRAIAADFGFSLSQAEEYKKTYGVAKTPTGGRIGQTTTLVLASIMNEIKKAIAFYTEKHKGEDLVRQIVLSGGTAKLPGIDAFFAQQVGIETVIANPWKVIVNQEVPAELQEAAPEYTIAVGLALKAYE